jgi:hypothetical protein
MLQFFKASRYGAARPLHMMRVVRSVNLESTNKLALILQDLNGVDNGIFDTEDGDAGRSCEIISTIMNRRTKGGESSRWLCLYFDGVSNVSES